MSIYLICSGDPLTVALATAQVASYLTRNSSFKMASKRTGKRSAFTRCCHNGEKKDNSIKSGAL